MDADSFEYKALPTANTIRLLELLEEDDAGFLQLTMRDANMGDKPIYNCLSYTWGAAQPPLDHRGEPNSQLEGFDAQWPVLCDGKMMMVGQNLYDFLQHLLRLRQAFNPEDNAVEQTHETVRGSESLQLPIWIDALCINKNDLQERSLHVKMMGRIYQKAQTVIVWLGAEGRETVVAIKAIQQLVNDRGEEKAKYFKDLTMHRMNFHDSRMLLGVTEISQDRWEDVVRFFCRRWFTRIWIKQEVILAQRVLCFCGMWQIAWDDLARASDYISKSAWSLFMSEMLGVQGLKNMMAAPCTIERVRSVHREGILEGLFERGGGHIFLRLRVQMMESRAAKSTDPRDRVYGLLGYSSMRESDKIVPDYTKGRFFRAAGDLERQISFPDDLRLLQTKASKFDMITDTASSNIEMGENAGSFTDLLELVLNLPLAYIKGGTRFDAFWRSLVCDTVGHQHPAPDDTRALALRYFAVEMVHRCFPDGPHKATPEQWQNLQRHKPLLQQLTAGQPTSAAEQARTIEEMRRRDAGERQSEDFTSGYREFYSWRRLFRTAQGYLGIAAQSSMMRDEVWVVPGSHAPLVLRPVSNGRYRLIGDAYVHGVMKGEALKMDSWQLRDITLE